MEDTISQTKAEFTRAKDRLLRDLSTTPDDRINWSPSATARTPIHLVAHAALSTTGMMNMFAGKPFPFSSMSEMDAASRTAEKEYTTREQVIGFLESSSAEYIGWLDSLTPDQIASTVSFPFGQFPMVAAITFPADHLRCHAAQLEYVQTIYGDLDWHM